MTEKNYTEPQRLALNTFVKLVRCTTSVTSDVHTNQLGDLTVSQFGIIEALYHLGPMSQKLLATKILKSPGNITTVINNLEKSGLVKRVKNKNDKRFYNVHLTGKGLRMISAIFPQHAVNIEKRLGVLTEKEQVELGRLLKKLSGSD